MRHLFAAILLSSLLFFGATKPVAAQPVASPRRATASASVLPSSTPSATTSAGNTASPAADIASSPSAELQQKIQEKKENDITDTEGGQRSKLALFLDQNPPQPLSWYNFLQHAIRSAVKKGMPTNIIVLVLLFPLIATIIAASKHIIGFKGFGIYIPAVLAVALVSTGIFEGLIIFVTIILAALISKRLLKNLKISYLPRTALLLWMISFGILLVLLIAPSINLVNLMSLNIFPILILVLLSENFLDAQASTKETEAIWLTAETIFLALFSGFILRWEFLQRLALMEPELLILFTAGINLFIGRYTSLRISEWFRFRSIIEE